MRSTYRYIPLGILCSLTTGCKKMRNKHMPTGACHIALVDPRRDRFLMGPQVRKSESFTNIGWETVGHQMKCHFAKPILQIDPHRSPIGGSGDVDPSVPQQASTKLQSLTAVVVAGNRQDRSHLAQTQQRTVQQSNRLLGRHAAIVNIPCDHNRVRMLIPRNPNQLLQRVLLKLQKIYTSQHPPQMPVGCVQNPHP
jgi:hypothetical protein